MTDGRGPGRVAAIAGMSPYAPKRPPIEIDLSDNTSQWGPPPSARATLAGLTDDQISRYPTPYADLLTAALAEHYGVGADGIATGCGSDDVIFSAIIALCPVGGTMALAVPTFSVVPSFGVINEVRVAEVEMESDGVVRADSLLATGADLYYLCSPNNPTGTIVGAEQLRALLEGTSSTVLLDEAYAEYADADACALLAEFDNLVILRTLSKAYGLAGLRVGYAIGHPSRIAPINVARGPYKVGSVAELLAVAVLREDAGWLEGRVAEVRSLRDELARRLAAAGFHVLQSQANFVAIVVDDAAAVVDSMIERGVLARAYPSLRVFGDLVRITVPNASQLDETFAALVDATSAGTSRSGTDR
jgi:histidinol-phosphate aminotransferase